MEQENLIPTFSLAEREHRWSRVRQLMAAEELSCLIGFPSGSAVDLGGPR